jgi:hypothetical protein
MSGMSRVSKDTLNMAKVPLVFFFRRLPLLPRLAGYRVLPELLNRVSA